MIDMREQFKLIVKEIKDERDREILEMIDEEIKIVSMKLNSYDSDTQYWSGRLTQAKIIRDIILLMEDDN